MFSMTKGQARLLAAILFTGLITLGVVIVGVIGGVSYVLYEGVRAVFG